MRIGFIGSGQIGSLLAEKFVAESHEVRLANSRGAASLRELSDRIGCRASTVKEVFSSSDVVVLAIPLGRVPELAAAAKLAPPATVFIDAGNYGPFRDGLIDEIEAGMSESEWVGRVLGRSVTKAWNTVLAATLATEGSPRGTAGRLAIPVSGDAETAVETTSRLVDETGFDPVYAGTIAESWRLQPGAPAYCTELTAHDMPKALASADRSRSAVLRDELINETFLALENPTRELLVQLIRGKILSGTGLPSV